MTLPPALRTAARDRWGRLRPEIVAHFDRLWREPELPLMEVRAAAALGGWLADHGFAVERGVGGLPTALVARYGPGDGPTLGILAEYDALPGLGNEAVPYRADDGRPAGHACGHNHIGPANVGAAIAARHVMEEHDLRGRLVVVGCPAEELLWGKLALLRAGVLAGLDALVTSHGDYQNGALSRPCLSCISAELIFAGVASHGGRRRSRNALEGLERTVQSMERLAATRFPEAVIGHTIRAGGLMPSITPSEARLWLTVRHESFEDAEEVYREILAAAEGAARSTRTTVTEQLIAATRGYLPNDTLARVLQASLEVVGPPAWTVDDVVWMERLSRAVSPDSPFVLDRSLALHTTGCDAYGQDDGEASWHVPLGRVNWAMPEGVLLHMWGTSALSGHPAGQPGPLMASEGLAIALVDLLADPETVRAAERERAARVGPRVLAPPRCGGYATMSGAPETFWAGTWRSPDTLG
jgi:aminobenzoyl-glutamate utilization protein B